MNTQRLQSPMLATPVLALAAALTVAMATPAALVGKLSTTLGFEGFGSLKVNTLIDKMLSPAGGSGKSDMTTAVNAAWAAVLFLLAAAVIIGVVRFATGSRGAGERIAAVLGGVVGLLVALNILA